MRMKRSNQPAFELVSVSDEEIQTALTVLDVLKEELKAHTKRRMNRIPDNVAWNEKATHLDYELRGNLSSIHCLKLELKHWIKRRRQKDASIGNADARIRAIPHRHLHAKEIR